jgi:hypothetical protein
MSSQEQLPGKVCVVCGQDCSGRPRVKDPRGRYYCRECYDEAARKRKAKSQAQKPAPPPPPDEPVDAELIPDDEDADIGLFGELSSSEQGAAAAQVQEYPCPSCGNPIPAGAVLCMRCGYNRQLGTRMGAPTVAQAEPSGGGAVAALGGVGSLLKKPWLAGAVPAVFFLVLFAMAKSNQDLAPAYLVLQGVFGLVVAILVLVKAFCQGVGTGFLCLCVPCYVIYFVFSDQNDNVLLKWVYGAVLLSSVLGYSLGGVLH